MVVELLKEGYEDLLKRIKLDKLLISSMVLSDFVTYNCNKLFTTLKLPHNFKKNRPITWESDEEYIQLRKRIQELKIFNDTTERRITLIQFFNLVLLKHEDQKQYLTQVVKNHRHRFPNSNKSTLIHNLF